VMSQFNPNRRLDQCGAVLDNRRLTSFDAR
jgi:hypothetical protein